MHKFEKILFSIVLIALLVSIGFNVHYKRAIDSIHTETYIDTIKYYKPIPKDSTVIKYVAQTLPVVPKPDNKPVDSTSVTVPVAKDSTATQQPADSATVVIPISQRYYREEEFEAWVSGYQPSLDSINVFHPNTVTTLPAKDPWVDISVGLQLGVGFTGKEGIQPYIGVGVNIGIPLRKFVKK
ncbi:MAG: hypothetical protein IKQ20_03360 [Bacteroidales bacterium]|nr:hypothetical protein [Bacteroidales bacterium]